MHAQAVIELIVGTQYTEDIVRPNTSISRAIEAVFIRTRSVEEPPPWWIYGVHAPTRERNYCGARTASDRKYKHFCGEEHKQKYHSKCTKTRYFKRKILSFSREEEGKGKKGIISSTLPLVLPSESDVASRRHLRSAGQRLLDIPRQSRSTFA